MHSTLVLFSHRTVSDALLPGESLGPEPHVEWYDALTEPGSERSLVEAWLNWKQKPTWTFADTYTGRCNKKGHLIDDSGDDNDQTAEMLKSGWSRDGKFDLVTRYLFFAYLRLVESPRPESGLYDSDAPSRVSFGHADPLSLWALYTAKFTGAPLTMLFNRDTGRLHFTTQADWYTVPKFQAFSLVFTSRDIGVAQSLDGVRNPLVPVEERKSVDPERTAIKLVEGLLCDRTVDPFNCGLYTFMLPLGEVAKVKAGPALTRSDVTVYTGKTPRQVRQTGVVCTYEYGWHEIVFSFVDLPKMRADKELDALIDTDAWEIECKTDRFRYLSYESERGSKTIVFFDNWKGESLLGGVPSQ